jgi:hypothetical protein
MVLEQNPPCLSDYYHACPVVGPVPGPPQYHPGGVANLCLWGKWMCDNFVWIYSSPLQVIVGRGPLTGLGPSEPIAWGLYLQAPPDPDCRLGVYVNRHATVSCKTNSCSTPFQACPSCWSRAWCRLQAPWRSGKARQWKVSD